MRNQRWWLGAGIVSVGVALTALGQRGWGQPGELPGLRPPSSPPALTKELDKPTRPNHLESQPPASLPAVKLPPLPSLPLPEATAPSRPRLPDATELLPPRNEPAPALPALSESLPSAKQDSSVSLEWVGAATAQLNQPMSCQILVRNTGPAPVHQVMVRHHLNPGVICKRTEPAAATERDDLVWTVGTLQPGQQRRLDLQFVASQRGALNCQATVTFASSAGQQVQVREPMLLVKMRAPEQAIVGENAPLLFAVANPGDGVAEQVKVRVLLPDGMTSARGRVVEMDIGNLAPKETRTLQVDCVAKTSGTHKSTIVASADGNLSASDHAVTDILEAKLDLVVQGPKLRYLERHAVYLLKVTNPGNAPAQNVTLNEVVPAGFKFHMASAGGRWDETTKTVSWQLGDVPPGQSREVSIDLLAAVAGDHRLQAQVVSSRGARTDASALTRIEGSSALVIELVDVDDPVEVGGETAYEIRVINAGTKMETNLEVTCTLPEQVEFKGAKSIAGVHHRVQGREVIFDPLPRLAPKADVIYRVTVRGLQAGDVRFRTRVRADGMPEPVLREENTRFYNDNVLPK